MYRADKAMWNPADIQMVIDQGQMCHLAMCDEDKPYVVTLSYGYRDGSLYWHCANAGRKLELLTRNPHVCFQIIVDSALVPCAFGMRFKSVVGEGQALVLADAEAKRRGLDAIMRHYGATGPLTYADSVLAKTTVVRVRVETLVGKQSL